MLFFSIFSSFSSCYNIKVKQRTEEQVKDLILMMQINNFKSIEVELIYAECQLDEYLI